MNPCVMLSVIYAFPASLSLRKNQVMQLSDEHLDFQEVTGDLIPLRHCHK